MNKCKKALTLLIGAASIVSLSACGGVVTEKANTLLSYETSDGSGRVDFTTNDLLINYFENNTASTQDLYNIVYEAMLKKYYEDRPTDLATLETEANTKVNEKKDEAQKNADTNQTSYDDEWNSILDTELSDFKDEKRTEEALYNKYLVEAMKTDIGDQFYNTFKEWNQDKIAEGDQTLQDKYNILFGENGYLEKRIPYHVSHILVNVDAASNTIYNGEISEDDAKQIYNVLEPLAHGDSSFGTVAEDHSDDTSADSFGNLGIMDKSTSFVNEFKLGIYIYDTLFNTDEQISGNAAADPFDLGDSENRQFFEDLGINFIPYEAVTMLNDVSGETTDSSNHQVNNGNAAYYPRNIIFNTYFNNHNISFITKEGMSIAGSEVDLNTNADTLAEQTITNYSHKGNNGETYYSDLTSTGDFKDVNNYSYTWKNGAPLTDGTLDGFQEITFNYDVNGDKQINANDKKEVLCDEKGNPIIVVRAGTSDYQGIHFIVVERSGLEQTKEYTYETEEGQTYNYTSTLAEYYASESPLTNTNAIETNAPYVSVDSDGTIHSNTGTPTFAKTTYINNVSSNYADYRKRAETLENTIRKFDPAYDYRAFSWLMEVTDFVNTDEILVTFGGDNETTINIKERVNNYVQNQIASNENSYLISEDTWTDYVEYLKNQQTQRKSKLIPLTCAIGFSGGYGESGNLYDLCHYEE